MILITIGHFHTLLMFKIIIMIHFHACSIQANVLCVENVYNKVIYDEVYEP